jgi:hypothetical protein
MKIARSTLFSILLFIIAVLIFLWDIESGWRFVGLLEIGFGIYIISKKEVGVGWEGCKPFFYLRGKTAVIVGCLTIALGFVFLLSPHTILETLGVAR